MMLYVDGESFSRQGEMIEVPDVSGLSVVEANRLLLSYGFEMRVSGSGVAVSQTPEAGETALPSSTSMLLAAFITDLIHHGLAMCGAGTLN